MPIKIGFIGTGNIAQTHINSLSKLKEVQLAAFCDVVEERAKAAADKFAAKAYTDHRKMLDEEELDALYICLPPHAHTDQEILAAEKGINLFLEKPLCNSMEKAKEIHQAIEKSDIIASVGYHWRYFDTTDKAKEILQDKTIAMVLGYWLGGLYGVPWWRVKSQSGGQIVEQTTHIFDLARYVVGEITKVYAAMSLRALKDVPNLDIPDVGTVNVEFANGAVGNISNTCILSQGYKVGLNIICKDLVVELSFGNLRIIEPGRTEELRPKLNPYDEENLTFINAVKTKDPSKIKSAYADAMKTLALSLAANQSAETGEPVEILS